MKNDLQVVAPRNRKMVDAKDGDIDKAVKARLAKDAQVKKRGRAHRRGRGDADR